MAATPSGPTASSQLPARVGRVERSRRVAPRCVAGGVGGVATWTMQPASSSDAHAAGRTETMPPMMPE